MHGFIYFDKNWSSIRSDVCNDVCVGYSISYSGIVLTLCLPSLILQRKRAITSFLEITECSSGLMSNPTLSMTTLFWLVWWTYMYFCTHTFKITRLSSFVSKILFVFSKLWCFWVKNIVGSFHRPYLWGFDYSLYPYILLFHWHVWCLRLLVFPVVFKTFKTCMIV